VQAGASAGAAVVALAVFVLIGRLGTGRPVALYLALGERFKDILDHLEGWMAQNNAAIMAVLCLIIGAKLIGDGISGFSG
jgi:Sap, sulfolipid-1-addressing protein